MPSVSTICVKPLHCPALSWEACFLCNHFPVVPVFQLHPFLFSPFLFLGCKFRYPILYALKLARICKSYTLANSDTPNSKAEFSIDTRWIPLAVRAEGQQWVTSIFYTSIWDVSQPYTGHVTQHIYLCTWCPWTKRTKPHTQKNKLWTEKTQNSHSLSLRPAHFHLTLHDE